MSSFSNPHYMYLFEMTNGKQKLAYGGSPEDALEILSCRLSEEEMFELFQMGNEAKRVRETKLNTHSSRAHTLFMLELI